jgi:hypothetical protein
MAAPQLKAGIADFNGNTLLSAFLVCLKHQLGTISVAAGGR